MAGGWGGSQRCCAGLCLNTFRTLGEFANCTFTPLLTDVNRYCIYAYVITCKAFREVPGTL